jgi:hypothetical protein
LAPRLRVGRLSVHRRLPKAGDLRLGFAGPSIGGFHCSQHRRRIRQAEQAREGALSDIAEGSREECRYYLILAQDLGYGDTRELLTSADEVSRLLNAYACTILASGS